MSYARWGAGSAVYVFAVDGGMVECCGCLLSPAGEDTEDTGWGLSRFFASVDALTDHMLEHRAAGHEIPDELLEPDTYDAEDFVP